MLVDYFLQITAFVSFLSWDEESKNAGNLDCIFCINYEQKEDEKSDTIRETRIQVAFKNKYIPFLKHIATKIVVWIIFILLLTFGIIGIFKFENGLEEQVSMVKDSDLYNYFTYEKKYIEIGPPAYLVLKNFNYRDEKDINLISDISQALTNLEATVQPPVYSWVNTFNLFVKQNTSAF